MSQSWKKGIDYPDFLTEEGLITLKGGYLLEGETPMQMYARVAKAASANVMRHDLEGPIFEALIKNWICLASPVAANLGTARGLPISCFGVSVSDSVSGISSAYNELMMMAKNGGGVGMYWGNVRGRGSMISQNGTSNGIVPWVKVQDSLTAAVNQGSVRNGASVAYLPIGHLDAEEFIRIRRPKGDPNTRCHNIHHAVIMNDDFMQKVELGDPHARKLWLEVLKTRKETGEPFIMFDDNVNRRRPEAYVKNELYVTHSQLCVEIALYTDALHSFVCCLSSLNLARYPEWKGRGIPYLAIWLLDGVMQEFINKTEGMPGMENARRFAVKSRALGLGGLGWHSLLQSEMTPFNSLRAKILNRAIWKEIRDDADKASRDMAKYLGEVEWTKGLGERNTHKLAVAPTTTNATMSADTNGHTVSFSIEPWPGNIFTQKSAKGTFVRRNPLFFKLLDDMGKHTPDVVRSIVEERGSVQHLSFLSVEQKEVFKTAYEVDQMAIVEQAADRQQFLDQGQSLNLFFKADSDLRQFNAVHLEAYKKGLYTLYYVRSESPIQGDVGTAKVDTHKDIDAFEPPPPTTNECTACES